MLNLLKIWIPVALAAAICLAGCSDDVPQEDSPVKGETPAGDVYICFRMNLSGDTPGLSRAGETSGTTRENAVNSVDLLVCDIDDDRLTDIVYLDKERIAQITSEDGIVIPVYAGEGHKVKVFAAVNMTDRMRRLFSPGQAGIDRFITSACDNYRDIIDEFVPGSDGYQSKLEESGGCIPMTGQFKLATENFDVLEQAGVDNEEIPLTKDHLSYDNPLHVVADVSRIVAKTHVVADANEFTLSSGEKVQYVSAHKNSGAHDPDSDGNPYADWIGWIRLSDVKYMPNAINKSSYIFLQKNEAATGKLSPWKDTNMSLSTGYFTGNHLDEVKFGNDFLFYSGVTLHAANITDGYPAQVEVYDETKYENTVNGAEGRYTAGMYCPENYFDTPTGNFFDSYDDVIPMVTHIAIAARLTPRKIVVVKDYAAKMDEFVKEYANNPEGTRKKYGFGPSDFSTEDITRWREMKEVYFSETTSTDRTVPYREDFLLVRMKSEDDAASLIKWSLLANEQWSGSDTDFENGKYPACTFYVYDTEFDPEGYTDTVWSQRYLYLTAGAVASATDTNIRIKTYSVPHVGGWGYYYTYIDQLKLTEVGATTKTPYKASQVTRNTYYLLHVANIGYPGGTITRPEYIKANTLPIGWDLEGIGDIDLH